MGLIWTPQQRIRQPQQQVAPRRPSLALVDVQHLTLNGKLPDYNTLSSIGPTAAGVGRKGGSSASNKAYWTTSLSGSGALTTILHWYAPITLADSYSYVFGLANATQKPAIGLRHNSYGFRLVFYDGASNLDSGLTVSAAGVHSLVITSDGSKVRFWFDNQYADVASSFSVSNVTRVIANGYDTGTTYGTTSPYLLLQGLEMRQWSAAEALEFIDNPWSVYAPTETPVWFTDAGGGITGTAAITDGSDTAAASGLITHLGISAITESGDVAAAIGYLSHLGTAAVTEGADAASAAGRITHTATAAVTEGSDTAEAIGTVGVTSITGTASITEAGDTATAIGYLSHLGSAAITESGDIAAATGTAGDPLHGFTQDQLDFLVAYMETHMAIPTAAENAAAVRAEIAVELAAVVRSEKWVRNKRTLDPATGMQRIYDDDGATVLGEGEAWLDADGAQPYDGSGAVHRTERLA